MRLHIPIKLPSLANTRIHWRAMDKLKRQQRLATKYSIAGKEIPPLPLLITITRIGPRRLDDDNLQAACKYVRDQIADYVGVDDGSPLYTWWYRQHVTWSEQYGVDVEIVERKEELLGDSDQHAHLAPSGVRPR